MWKNIWRGICDGVKWCFEIPTEFDFVCRENCSADCEECDWWRAIA